MEEPNPSSSVPKAIARQIQRQEVEEFSSNWEEETEMEGETAGLEMITELRLGLPGSDPKLQSSTQTKRKRLRLTAAGEGEEEESSTRTEEIKGGDDQKVVGWPPVCSYRKISFKGRSEKERSEVYVKVSMDGAPFLRKIHLKACRGYSDLSRAFATMFSNLSLGENCSNSEYTTVYEDKDGDWMLVGDVPFEMFVESCKRLRIMRRTEAINMSTGLEELTKKEKIVLKLISLSYIFTKCRWNE